MTMMHLAGLLTFLLPGRLPIRTGVPVQTVA